MTSTCCDVIMPKRVCGLTTKRSWWGSIYCGRGQGNSWQWHRPDFSESSHLIIARIESHTRKDPIHLQAEVFRRQLASLVTASRLHQKFSTQLSEQRICVDFNGYCRHTSLIVPRSQVGFSEKKRFSPARNALAFVLSNWLSSSRGWQISSVHNPGVTRTWVRVLFYGLTDETSMPKVKVCTTIYIHTVYMEDRFEDNFTISSANRNIPKV